MTRGARTAARNPATAADLGLMLGSPPDPSRLVTVANWQEGPMNRWSFQHASELVPSAVVSRGSTPVLPLVEAPEELDGLVLDGVSCASTLEAFLEQTYADGFLVLKGGRIVFERYFNGMLPATRHLLMSVSKSLCGILAGGNRRVRRRRPRGDGRDVRARALGLDLRGGHHLATARHDRVPRVRRGLRQPRVRGSGPGPCGRVAAPADRGSGDLLRVPSRAARRGRARASLPVLLRHHGRPRLGARAGEPDGGTRSCSARRSGHESAPSTTPSSASIRPGSRSRTAACPSRSAIWPASACWCWKGGRTAITPCARTTG